ncbi:MAG: sulfatase [Planctomycetales bacterium]
MVSFRHLLCVAALWTALLSPHGLLTAAERPPNVIILLADDMGYADVGFQGCQDIPTPHIDSIARNGVRFTQGYVSGPYCSPTRAGLMTGRYQTRFGHEFNLGEKEAGPGIKKQPLGLPLTETTFADRMKKAGYATGLVGKWHLGELPEFHPQKRGFDEFFGFLGGALSYFPLKKTQIQSGTTPHDEQEYLTDAFGREAVSFIDRHKEHPFFLYLAFNAVHTPMEATDARLQKFASITDSRRRTYAAMLSAMDDAIGNVLEKVRTSGLEENTLFFFFSDNGGPTMPGTTVNSSSNAPLRGSKRTTLEGGIRVPFAIQWKGKLPAGVTYDQPIIQLDLLPTALAAAGVTAKPDWKLDGVNLLPYLTGQNSAQPHQTLYWRFGPQFAIHHGDWKLVAYDPQVESSKRLNRLRNDPVGPPKLYNLKQDIGETRDLTSQHPEKVAALQKLWQDWNAQQAPPLWGATPGI